MKATLEFDMNDEQDELRTAINGRLYSCALWDIKQRIRSVLKYNEEITVEQLCYQLQELIPELDS